nr:SigF/SigG family RNA polymerase sporulation sigma factor [uncultured Sellimonas sp.]
MDSTTELIDRAHHGDTGARDRLVEENIGLVWCVVRRYSGRGTEMEDLFQIGSIGLLKAIDKFDLSYDVRFSTYAVPMISGEIRRFLRDDGMLKVSRSLKEISYKACQAKEEFLKRYNREPTVLELAEASGIAKEELVEAMEASAEVESLHRPVCRQDGKEAELLEKLEQDEKTEEKIIDQMFLYSLLEKLGKEERQLIYLRYFENKTQSETGKRLGISQVQVSRLEKKILKQMREYGEQEQ